MGQFVSLKVYVLNIDFSGGDRAHILASLPRKMVLFRLLNEAYSFISASQSWVGAETGRRRSVRSERGCWRGFH